MGVPREVVRKSVDGPIPTLHRTLPVVPVGHKHRIRGAVPGGTTGSLPAAAGGCTLRDMKKRVLAAFLWFYTGWYAGAMLADFVGVSPFLGPIIGAAVAGMIAGDPRQIIWKARSMSTSAREATPEAA